MLIELSSQVFIASFFETVAKATPTKSRNPTFLDLGVPASIVPNANGHTLVGFLIDPLPCQKWLPSIAFLAGFIYLNPAKTSHHCFKYFS